MRRQIAAKEEAWRLGQELGSVKDAVMGAGTVRQSCWDLRRGRCGWVLINLSLVIKGGDEELHGVTPAGTTQRLI
ncbi:hypothetical protein M0R45_019437 [Rubus argutus]|uniref:Uncharacterized protein n=1 Tax=Rubus argutus TaxID=59490 RepID=A0AAW1X923_RUBAR